MGYFLSDTKGTAVGVLGAVVISGVVLAKFDSVVESGLGGGGAFDPNWPGGNFRILVMFSGIVGRGGGGGAVGTGH